MTWTRAKLARVSDRLGRPCRLPIDNTAPRVLAQNLDVYASGISFDGWTDRRPFLIPRGYEPLPVARASTALLEYE